MLPLVQINRSFIYCNRRDKYTVSYNENFEFPVSHSNIY